jgi:SNF2 family DNA or RNA helicase
LKSHITKASRAAKKLNSNVCIGLTGSPINNTAAEFENLVNIIASHRKDHVNDGLKLTNVSAFVKRRLKTDVNPETGKTLLFPTPGK